MVSGRCGSKALGSTSGNTLTRRRKQGDGQMAKAKRRKSKRMEKTTMPGCMPLPEDTTARGPAVILRLPPELAKRPGPKVNGGRRLSRNEVWEKLEASMRTLRALPDKERRFFVVKSGYPDFVRDYIDAYGSVEEIAPKFQPTPSQISEYLEVLSWARHLERREWQILWWRSFGTSYGVIAKYIGRSDEAARKRFENALTDVWIAANGV